MSFAPGLPTHIWQRCSFVFRCFRNRSTGFSFNNFCLRTNKWEKYLFLFVWHVFEPVTTTDGKWFPVQQDFEPLAAHQRVSQIRFCHIGRLSSCVCVSSSLYVPLTLFCVSQACCPRSALGLTKSESTRYFETWFKFCLFFSRGHFLMHVCCGVFRFAPLYVLLVGFKDGCAPRTVSPMPSTKRPLHFMMMILFKAPNVVGQVVVADCQREWKNGAERPKSSFKVVLPPVVDMNRWHA